MKKFGFHLPATAMIERYINWKSKNLICNGFSYVLHYHTAHKSLCSLPISSVEGEKDIGFYKAMCLVAIDGWIW